MLDESEKNTLKAILRRELTDAEENMLQLKEILQPVSPDTAIGRLSRMDAVEMQSVNTTKYMLQQKRARQIRSALDAIETDENFGLCLDCDRLIDIERLKLMPESRYCVSCLESR